MIAWSRRSRNSWRTPRGVGVVSVGCASSSAVVERGAAAPATELQAWLAWAQAHCDDLDPLSERALAELQAYAASLQSPPDLPLRHPEEAIWRDMGLLDDLVDEV